MVPLRQEDVDLAVRRKAMDAAQQQVGEPDMLTCDARCFEEAVACRQNAEFHAPSPFPIIAAKPPPGRAGKFATIAAKRPETRLAATAAV
jgi:hypothetical protein